MQITDQTVVRFNYTLTNDAGDVIDTSEGREPLDYLHGNQSIVPGLEDAMVGKQAGDSFQVAVEPDQGYGPSDPQLIQPVPRDRFAGVDKIEPGMQFQAQTPDGHRMVVVREVNDQEVTIDANHPLAGQTLHFDIEIVDVRQATEEEIAHGHVHGSDCNHG